MRRDILCLAVSSVIILASFVALMSGIAKADEPIVSGVDLHTVPPNLEVSPSSTPVLGQIVSLNARVTAEGEQTWSKHGVVLDQGNPGQRDSYTLSAPSVVFEDGEYKMWYAGNDNTPGMAWILYANSSDGITWNRQGVVLSPSGSWPGEDQQVHYPSVLKNGTEYKMWYTGYGASGQFKIFHAVSPDGIS